METLTIFKHIQHVTTKYQKQMTDDKTKWELTLNFIMIVGKYFNNSNDFINAMKVCKRYKELVSMYKFNPISDISIFENIQTQHFYKENDVRKRRKGLYKYIHWYEADYDDLRKNYIVTEEGFIGNNIYKNVFLTPLNIKDGVKEFNVPECVTRIEHNCFSYRSELTKVTLPSSLKEIGEESFLFCSMETIIIPDGVTKIGDSCFQECSNLTTIKLPIGIKELNKDLFKNSELKNIDIPEGVTRIGKGCFSNCYCLEDIILPYTLKEIDDMAFSRTNIGFMSIPNSVSYLGDDIFEKCQVLAGILLNKKFENDKYRIFDSEIDLINGDFIIDVKKTDDENTIYLDKKLRYEFFCISDDENYDENEESE